MVFTTNKFPNNLVFADFFPELTDQDPKSNYLKVIKLIMIRYHLPPIVKHVLPPQNDFGMRAKTTLTKFRFLSPTFTTHNGDNAENIANMNNAANADNSESANNSDNLSNTNNFYHMNLFFQ